MAVNPVHVIDFSFLEEDDEMELPSQTRLRSPSATWRSNTVPHLAAIYVDFSLNENEDIPDNPYDPSFTVDLSFLDDDARAETRVYPTVGFHEPCIRSFTEPTPPPPPASEHSALYEKQVDSTAHPTVSASGTRHYVVSEPDPRATPYEVPYGAYPTSAPYQPYARTEAPTPPNARFASTSTGFAHPLADRVPRRGENA